MGGVVGGSKPSPPPPPVQPAPVVRPSQVVKVGEKDENAKKKLAMVRTGVGTGAGFSKSVLGAAPTDTKQLLGS